VIPPGRVGALKSQTPLKVGAPRDRQLVVVARELALNELKDHADPMGQAKTDDASFALLFDREQGDAFDAFTASFLRSLPPQQRLTLLLVYGERFDTIDAGRVLFGRYGCSSCHALADANAVSVVGPALDALADPASEHATMHGTDLRGYVEQSIVDPSAFVVAGFADGLMPKDFATRIPAGELAILVDYLIAQK